MSTFEQRADWAAIALDEYGNAKAGSVDYAEPESMAVDLICDLLHLIDQHGAHDALDKLEAAARRFRKDMEFRAGQEL